MRRLITSGWIIPPAKSTDMVAITAIVREMHETLKQLSPVVVKLTEDVRSLDLRLESADRKLDRLIDRPAYPVTIQAATDDKPRATQARKRTQPQKTGVLGF